MFIKRVVLITAMCALCLMVSILSAREYHVSPEGNDFNEGSGEKPLCTISAAARWAQPGDAVTVHKGVYRERINPPRGGSSESQRIVYQAAPGETVIIKGSEIIKGWQKVQHDTWKVTLPNSFFGDFNPYDDQIRGDWFDPKGRLHHTGAVYLNDHWLTEASQLEDVLQRIGQVGLSYLPGPGGAMLNVSWWRPKNNMGESERIQAESFVKQHGVQKAPCSEGGDCIGWIDKGDWVCYEQVDFGRGADQIEIRAASLTQGGVIEIHKDRPDGELLGSCSVPNTGGWQKWESFTARIKAISGAKTICMVFRGAGASNAQDVRLWFARVSQSETTIWAQFKDVNPNEGNVEINVRQCVFYPDKPGSNYITVRGFKMMHAATNWAPPTAEQVGLIGTHWSKGWIIENNDIRYSVCTGLTLGKYGDEFDNTSQDSAEGYVKTIERGLANGWSKENVGSHIVRNNHISHCEQAGIVGSLGPIFSTVTGNTIHDIHVRQLFTGAEMAGIKFHGAVDTIISHNHIYRTTRGIWLDWMTQGTRVTGNLLHDNGPSEDITVEVNQGPFLIDNNILLSGNSILTDSQGGAYVHNLIGGRLHVIVGDERLTPYLKEHATEVVDLAANPSGDERYYNNIFVNGGLEPYDRAVLPVFMDGNVSLKGAKPSKHETGSIVQPDTDPGIKLVQGKNSIYLHINLDKEWSAKHNRKLVTTKLLGKAKTPDLPYVQPDGSPYCIDNDYFGKKRNVDNPFPGPFELPEGGEQALKMSCFQLF